MDFNTDFKINKRYPFINIKVFFYKLDGQLVLGSAEILLQNQSRGAFDLPFRLDDLIMVEVK